MGDSNARILERKRTLFEAFLAFDGRSVPASVLDISAGGARLRIEGETTGFPETLPVILNLGQFGKIPARIAWRQGDHLGMRFLADESYMADTVMALAVYARG
ncbi:MAG: hypothetical protein A2516_11655 [Alphaproteobacteria bacterium RIFOXYD12_FULL_60_8]|nr:MAG: hypothetical protein A2516_11655 [Alphaproteobacteria bacterium RIFOXYD12_FULL_60_8]